MTVSSLAFALELASAEPCYIRRPCCKAGYAAKLKQRKGAVMATPVEQLLTKLPDAKATANGWSSYCPAHDDRRASLSICEGHDGRALVKCHAGCTVDAI